MNNIGRKIFYDILNGNVLLEIGEMSGYVVKTTIEQDIESFKSLSERNRDSFDYIELEFGQFAQDFAESNGYRVNPETKELEFSYLDPNEEQPQDPVFRKPLSEEIEEIKNRLMLQDTVMEELMFGLIPEITGGGI